MNVYRAVRYALKMRVLLRIVAIAILLAVVATAKLIWSLAAFVVSGTFGVATLVAWTLTLTVGPFAAIQLWRLRESGRKAALFLASSAFVFYIVSGLFFRRPGPVNPAYWLALAGYGGLTALLLSRYARSACRTEPPT